MRIFEIHRGAYVPKIRIINLVDILLVLLLFLFVTTTFRAEQEPTAAVKVSLPEARTGEAVGKTARARLQIQVTTDERLFLGDRQIGLRELEEALREARAKDQDVQVELSADRSVNYGTVVAIVDAARAAGVLNITAFTRRSVTTDDNVVP